MTAEEAEIVQAKKTLKLQTGKAALDMLWQEKQW